MAADPIPPTAFDPSQPGAAFSPGDFYQAYINALNAAQSGQPAAAVTGAGGQELFNLGLPEFGLKTVPGNIFLEESAGGKAPTFTDFALGTGGTQIDPSRMLTPLENKQLNTFTETGAGTEPGPMSGIDTFVNMLPQLASIAAILGSAGLASPAVAGADAAAEGAAAGTAASAGAGAAASAGEALSTIGPVLGGTTGTLVGQKLGGPQGAQIGGVAGGLAGGAAAGGLSGAGDGFSSTAPDAGISGFGTMGSQMPQIGGDLFNSTAPDPGISGFGSLGSQMPQIGTPTGVGGVLGGASPGVNPKGVGGAGGGGPGPGSSLGTDPTGGTVAGGASGGATAPGSTAIGTGATETPATQSTVAQNVFKDFNDLGTAARFAQSLDALTSGTQAQGGQAPATMATQQPSVAQSPVSAIPSAAAAPISQIAASAPPQTAIPSGEFQSITQDFAKQTENAIRAQFANQGISGSPMEQRQIQGIGAQATQRASAAEQAMTAAGVSDPNVFAALLVSNISPDEFASSLQRLRAQNAI